MNMPSVLIRTGNLHTQKDTRMGTHRGNVMCGHSEKAVTYKLKRVASEETKPTDTLILEF